MRVEPCLQLSVRRGRRRGAIQNEFQFLSDPASHHWIIAIEAHRDALAVEDLLFHPVVDQSPQFLFRCRSLPYAFELQLQALQLSTRYDDLVRQVGRSKMEPA